MQFAKNTDYALHALVHLANSECEYKIGIKELSNMLDVSESYLSKIMTKLRKDGIVRAVPGVKGGYELSRSASHITFLDVILSTEGRQQMFNCSNSDSRQHTLLTDESNVQIMGKEENLGVCRIKEVMDNAESALHLFFKNHSIQSILDKANKDCNNHLQKERD
ncbi:RrF2 family transcriptional regulator [Paenibacillus crassostreae]|uniref:Rrf2 family transcriptional regulator n=1 Tax=Paenibacillus crassostreae TaxID=1763538 RepID=A0A167DPS8_9BACL|nr:Rrf2 family transcriptional regulator [Paenibacillus crassostreae]AOZ91204.1 transcriptional regulator [Paenibacillus crassostreae]OAB74638.1 Rrf2 family transcriptional regulator [Paenibacillus crassostreae]